MLGQPLAGHGRHGPRGDRDRRRAREHGDDAGATTRRAITFLVLKFPLRDAEGQIYAVCSIATDITERRRSAEERAELEARLAQAQRLECVGQLAGGVAHDFNNLLSVILTCVGFAQRALPDDHPVRDDVEEIGRAADRAAALTRQLLMFSRREVVTPEVVDVAALVRDLERLLNRTLGERVALRISCGPAIAPVLVDRAQLEQVLVNLAVNARDAMPDGGTLSIARRPGTSDGVRITVADDGTGMPAEVRERAFEPFFTTKEPGEGTGLGLATRPRHRHRRRRHGRDRLGGRRRDRRDDLPARGRAERRRARGADPPGAAAAGRRAGARRRGPGPGPAPGVPDPRGARLHRTEAASADEALAGWAPVDVLVTDVVMPGMSGQQLAEHARDLAPELRIVFMSGHTDDIVVRDGARHGDIAFVQKPFTRDSLLRAVEEALQKPPPAGSNGASAAA